MNNSVTTRATDIFAVRWAMKYLLHVRNRVHHYNLLRLFSAIDRPKGVGLLTVCNHVSTLDSASIVPSIIPLRTFLSVHSLSGNMLTSRNCGFWNLAAEEILFSTPLKNRISSLVKVPSAPTSHRDHAHRPERRCIPARAFRLHRAGNPRGLGAYVPRRPHLSRPAEELPRFSGPPRSKERENGASRPRLGTTEMGSGEGGF